MMVMENIGKDDLPKAAAEILKNSFRIIGFEGELGAGKTTLIKEICRQLGVNDTMSSPTFNLVNSYDAGNEPVYHFDLYRVKDAAECLDLGITEYLDSGNYCLIEWPEVAEPILAEYDLSLIKIEQTGDELRRIFVVHT